MSHRNDELIQRFYSAFAEGRGGAMAACYAPDVHFSDPVFTDLNGPEAGLMWTMLTSTPGELRIELLEHVADDERGSANWRAHYVFSDTGRPVVNDVRASFRFERDLIADHHDEFSFHAWSRQALGPLGLLLGWTPILRSAVQKKAAGKLDEYMRAPEAASAPG